MTHKLYIIMIARGSVLLLLGGVKKNTRVVITKLMVLTTIGVLEKIAMI